MKGTVKVTAHFMQNCEAAERQATYLVDGEKLGPVTAFWLLPLVGEDARVDKLAILNMGLVRYVEMDEPKKA